MVRSLVLIAGFALALPMAQAWAQPVPQVPAPMAVPSHLITGVIIRYSTESGGLPPAEALLKASFEAVATQDGWTAPQPRESAERIRLDEIPGLKQQRFTDAGLTLLAPAVVRRLRELGLVGVYATPDPAQFRVEDGRVIDLRGDGVTTITMDVTLGIITEVNTRGIGERLPKDDTINSPLHQRIRDNSPVQPAYNDQPQANNLVQQRAIDDYLFFLNRLPGRRADVAVAAAGTQPGAVSLDYIITENRPWLLFAQISSTGTESTSRLRENFGFINNNLTNHDDILSLGYQTASFQDTHAVNGSYERPFCCNDRLRWRVDGSYYHYLASDVGLPDADFKGEGYSLGGSIAWNFYQRRALFLDLVGGVQFKHVEVNNEAAALEGDDDFFMPSLALRLERNITAMRTNATIGIEFNASGIAGTNDNLDALGRTGADSDFVVLRGEATHSFYLEPFFDRNAESTGGLAHEIFLSTRGQYAFDNRLIPNEEQVAGGLYTVRGYPESATAGDTVIVGTAEYRYHLAKNLDPNPMPGSLFGHDFRWRPQYQYGPTDWDLILKAFVDAGRVTNSDRQSFESDNTLIGAGIGAELSVSRHFNLRVDWGFALRDLNDAGSGDDVNAGDSELSFVLTLIY